MGPGFFLFFPKQYIKIGAKTRAVRKAVADCRKNKKSIKKVARKWAKLAGSDADVFRIKDTYQINSNEAFNHYVELIEKEICEALRRDDEAMLMVIFSI